jgi:hypothetical protein
MKEPPIHVIRRAVVVAGQSHPGRCVKSYRGAVVFDPSSGMIHGWGYNSPPIPMRCTGSPECRAHCALICEHAEGRAIRMALQSMRLTDEHQLHLVHVKISDNGRIAPSGRPSCVQCSRVVLEIKGLAGVWLYHEVQIGSGGARAGEWHFYHSQQFHELSLQSMGITP